MLRFKLIDFFHIYYGEKSKWPNLIGAKEDQNEMLYLVQSIHSSEEKALTAFIHMLKSECFSKMHQKWFIDDEANRYTLPHSPYTTYDFIAANRPNPVPNYLVYWNGFKNEINVCVRNIHNTIDIDKKIRLSKFISDSGLAIPRGKKENKNEDNDKKGKERSEVTIKFSDYNFKEQISHVNGDAEKFFFLFIVALLQVKHKIVDEKREEDRIDVIGEMMDYFSNHDSVDNTANVDEYGFIPLANESKTKKDEFIAISFKTDSTNEKDATGNDIVTVLKEKLTERLNIVVGNGGIGKSTLLSKSLKHVLAEKYQIPIMYKSVELKNFSQAAGFYQFITGKCVISEEEQQNIDSFFSAGNKHFVIGLDAIDEMTDRKDAFYNGLKKALREWKNVSFILTTRYTSDLDQLKAYITEVKGNTYTLTGITATNIINYLDKDTNNSEKSHKKIGEEIYYGVSEYMREQLMPVPLFLEKIKQLIDGADSDPLEMLKKVNSTSRLFDMFYEREANEKRGVLESRYVYDFVIPYICFSIKKKTNSEISESELQKQIDYVLREYYADNQSVFKGEVIPATIDAESGIIEAMQSGLTILQVDESKTDDYYFTFSHAIIGSYFSAKFIVNTINIASNKKVTPLINFIKSSGIGDVRWSSEVLDYVNQLLFENAEDGKKAIQNILNAYNGKEMPECLLQNILNLLSFNRNKVYAVSGATASSAETRKKMSKNATPTDVNNGIIKEYTFKGLDFKGCRINGMKFRNCRFEGCTNIDENTISPVGHRTPVSNIVILPDSSEIISIDENRSIMVSDIYDVKDSQLYHDIHTPRYYSLKKIGQQIAVYLYDAEDYEKLLQFLSSHADVTILSQKYFAPEHYYKMIRIGKIAKGSVINENCSGIYGDYIDADELIATLNMSDETLITYTSKGIWGINPDNETVALGIRSISTRDAEHDYILGYNFKNKSVSFIKQCKWADKEMQNITFTDNGSQILCANNKEMYLYKVSGHMHSDKKYSFYCTDKEKNKRELYINHSSFFYLPDGRKATLISDKNNLYISMLTNEKRSEVQKEAHLIYTAKYEISCIAVERNKNADNSYFIALGDICGDIYSLSYNCNSPDKCKEYYFQTGLEPWATGGMAFYKDDNGKDGFITVSPDNKRLDFYLMLKDEESGNESIIKKRSLYLEMNGKTINVSSLMHTTEKIWIAMSEGVICKNIIDVIDCRETTMHVGSDDMIHIPEAKDTAGYWNLIPQYHNDNIVFLKNKDINRITQVSLTSGKADVRILEENTKAVSVSRSGNYIVQALQSEIDNDKTIIRIRKTESDGTIEEYSVDCPNKIPKYVFFDDVDNTDDRPYGKLILCFSHIDRLHIQSTFMVLDVKNCELQCNYTIDEGYDILSATINYSQKSILVSNNCQYVHILNYADDTMKSLFVNTDLDEDKSVFARTFCYFTKNYNKILVSTMGRRMRIFNPDDIKFEEQIEHPSYSSAWLKDQKYIEVKNIPCLDFSGCKFTDCTYGEESPDTIKQILSLNGATLGSSTVHE